MTAKKKVTVPKVSTARADPGEKRLAFTPLRGSEILEVEDQKLTPPALVLALAAKVGGTPWLWTVADDHVSIIMTTGQKYHFDRE
jgi:hypothetical protein